MKVTCCEHCTAETPTEGTTGRAPACHDSCKVFKAEKVKMQKGKAEIAKDQNFNNYHCDAMRAYKKVGGCIE